MAIAGGGAVVAGVGAGAYFLIGDGGTEGPNGAPEAGSGIASVGTVYLEEFPDEADADLLADQLGISPTRADAMAYLSSSADVIAGDFDDGDVVALQGWRLSVSEARASALIALIR